MTKEEQYDPEKKMLRREDPGEVIAELMREKGFSRSVRFDGDWEGDTLPGGVPNESGSILTEDGRVFRYWLGWDPDKTVPDGTKGWYDLGEKSFWTDEKGVRHSYFEEVAPDDSRYSKPDDTAFLGAKRKLDLPLTEQELNVLRAYWKGHKGMTEELRL